MNDIQFNLMDKTRLSCILALTIGTGAAIIYAGSWWLKGKKLKSPKKWRKVGELTEIFIFPVKSLGYIRETEVECTMLGCKSGQLVDRTLMVTDLDGKGITARKFPQMILIEPRVSGSILTLNAPGMMSISIDLMHISKSFTATLWSEQVLACDCGEEVARWLSRYLLQEETGFRLVFYPLDTPCRKYKAENRGFPLVEQWDTGSYTDATSYTLMNEASVMDLNTRVKEEMTPLRFRMNFTVKGAEPFEEDTWDWVKIGPVIFRNVRPCTRCLMTTIDHETGVKNSAIEPLKTLKTYRQIEDPAIRRYVGESPQLGIHMGLKGPSGFVKLGDSVYVGVLEDEVITPSTP